MEQRFSPASGHRPLIDVPIVSSLYRYPIKSTAAERLERVTATREGLDRDRRFMVAKPNGRFVTARTHSRLQRVIARFDGEYLSVSHDDQTPLTESRRAFAGEAFATRVWADAFDALTTTPRLDAWFSRVVGEPVHLLWIGQQSARYRRMIDTHVSFADGYPLLLTSEASLSDLNARTDGSHVMAQFRPNLVIRGCDAFAEDRWKRLRIGPVVFRVDAPCARCVMTTVDPERGTRRADGEPLKTLGAYRGGDGNGIYFGQNLVVEHGGEIALGQAVEVVA